MAVIVERDKKMLNIQISLEKPSRSISGKTLLVASTRGVFKTDVKIQGKPVSLVVNAFIPRDEDSPGDDGGPIDQPRHQRKAKPRNQSDER